MNIAEILKDAPAGTKLYSLVHGEVDLVGVYSYGIYPIAVYVDGLGTVCFTKEGYYFNDKPTSEPILFPSKEQRDWSKLRADLPVGTPVVIFESVYKPFYANIRRYAGDGRYFMMCEERSTYPYIVPFNKIKIEDGEFVFDKNDNYGTCGKEERNGN